MPQLLPGLKAAYGIESLAGMQAAIFRPRQVIAGSLPDDQPPPGSTPQLPGGKLTGG